VKHYEISVDAQFCFAAVASLRLEQQPHHPGHYHPELSLQLQFVRRRNQHNSHAKGNYSAGLGNGLKSNVGDVDFPAVIRAAKQAGVKHYFVEQDETPGTPSNRCAKASST
jgi:hypothetical protein